MSRTWRKCSLTSRTMRKSSSAWNSRSRAPRMNCSATLTSSTCCRNQKTSSQCTTIHIRRRSITTPITCRSCWLRSPSSFSAMRSRSSQASPGTTMTRLRRSRATPKFLLRKQRRRRRACSAIQYTLTILISLRRSAWLSQRIFKPRLTRWKRTKQASL